jgi:hypothetical protein
MIKIQAIIMAKHKHIQAVGRRGREERRNKVLVSAVDARDLQGKV